MPVAVALIRGINVGSTRSLPMDLLRRLCEQVGMRDVKTYIQSGNVVFRWAGKGPAKGLAKAAEDLEGLIEADRGFRPGVVVRTQEELVAAITANPFADRAEKEPSKLLVMFLKEKPRAGGAAALEQVKHGRERMELVGRELFLDFPDGIGKSKLSLAAVEKAVGVGTGRNWNTVLRLAAMAEELASA